MAKGKSNTQLREEYKSMVGQKIGRLTILKFLSPKEAKRGTSAFLVKCECGSPEKEVNCSSLGKSTNSCGCLHTESSKRNNLIHGHLCGSREQSAEYRAWSYMKNRCYNPNVNDYEIYGGKGIVVCDRWLESFSNFLEDMGERPTPNHSVDRIDGNGNYEPSNCRWSDQSTQGFNQKKSVLNKTGYVGVNYHRGGKWVARIGKRSEGIPRQVLGRSYHIADAIIPRIEKEIELYGYNKNTVTWEEIEDAIRTNLPNVPPEQYERKYWNGVISNNEDGTLKFEKSP